MHTCTNLADLFCWLFWRVLTFCLLKVISPEHSLFDFGGWDNSWWSSSRSNRQIAILTQRFLKNKIQSTSYSTQLDPIIQGDYKGVFWRIPSGTDYANGIYILFLNLTMMEMMCDYSRQLSCSILEHSSMIITLDI